MLYAYVEQNPSISVTYIVSGITASEQKVCEDTNTCRRVTLEFYLGFPDSFGEG